MKTTSQKKDEEKDKEKLKEMALKVNKFLLQVLDMAITKEGYIYSYVEDSIISINKKLLKMYNINKNDIAFRPVYNPKLMLILYSLYTKKILKESKREIEYWEYSTGNLKKDKISIGVKEAGYDEILYTKAYWNDSLRFLELICLLEEIEPPVDLEELDSLLI